MKAIQLGIYEELNVDYEELEKRLRKATRGRKIKKRRF